MQYKPSKQQISYLSNEAARASLSVSGVGELVQAPIQLNLLSREYIRGIVVFYDDDGITFDVFLTVLYGYSIPVIAFAVQESIKKNLEAISEIKLNKINIHVQGISC